MPRAATEGGGHRLNSRCVNHSHTPSLVHNLSKLERVCTLSRLPDTLRSRTHLFAMVAPNDLLGHWLAHYAALGGEESKMSIHMLTCEICILISGSAAESKCQANLAAKEAITPGWGRTAQARLLALRRMVGLEPKDSWPYSTVK